MRTLRLNMLKVSLVSVAIAAAALLAGSHWNDRSAAQTAPWSPLAYLFTTPPPSYGIANIIVSVPAYQKLTIEQRFEFDFATTRPAYQPRVRDPIAHLIEVSVPLPTLRPAMDHGDPITWVVVNDTNDVMTSLVASGLDDANKSVANVNLLGGKWNTVEPGALAVSIIKRDLAGCGLYLIAATLQKSNAPLAAVVDVCSAKNRRVLLTTFTPLPPISVGKGA